MRKPHRGRKRSGDPLPGVAALADPNSLAQFAVPKPLGHQRSRAGVPDPIGSGAAKAGGTRVTKGEVGAVATGATVPEAGKTAGALPDLPITTISIAFPWVVMM
jgi:hypothetical protein